MDWRTASLSDYFETMEARGEAGGGNGGGMNAAEAERLRNFNKAHGI